MLIPAAALIAALAFLGLVAATVPALLQLARTARAAEQTLAALEREIRPLAGQVQALLQEHRTLAQQATRDLRQIEGVVVVAQDTLARITSLTGILARFGTVGQVLSVAGGLRKGLDVFVNRLVRGRGRKE